LGCPIAMWPRPGKSIPLPAFALARPNPHNS
jgi:hypothetical protein